jgi:hypothetical protein
MTRQPAEEKRITVACPMPRLAPVKSSVRRGPLWAEVAINVLSFSVMPGLVPGIHVLLLSSRKKDVDGRDEPGHDDLL